MHGIFDQFAKEVTQEGVAPACVSTSEHEVHPDALRADLFVEPDPARLALLDPLGLLGRACRRACSIEFFRGTPGPLRIEPCFIKILAFRRERRRDNEKRLRAASAEPAILRPLPVQRIFTSGRPEAVLRGFAFDRAHGWGRGVYRAPQQLATLVIVANELPVTRYTMLVRLVAGNGKVQAQAAEELRALPPEAIERRVAGSIMLRLGPEIEARRVGRSRETEEFRAMYQSAAEWMDKKIADAAEKVMEQTLVGSLRRVYEARFGPMPKGLAAALSAMHDPDVLDGWLGLFATRSASEVAAAIRPHAPARRARSAKATV